MAKRKRGFANEGHGKQGPTDQGCPRKYERRGFCAASNGTGPRVVLQPGLGSWAAGGRGRPLDLLTWAMYV